MELIRLAKSYKYGVYLDRRYNERGSKVQKIKNLLSFIAKDKLFLIKGNDLKASYANQFSRICSFLKPELYKGYIYPYDPSLVREVSSNVRFIFSTTVDYSKVFNQTLVDVYNNISTSNLDERQKTVYLNIIGSIKSLINKISAKLLATGDERSHTIAGYLNNINDKPVCHFDEAIQRLLFFNGLLWQMQHEQNGLGRLDYILYPYYQADCKAGILDREKAKNMLSNLKDILGKDMVAKSAALIGDTGQVIILGGVDENGDEFSNELTEIFLELYEEKPVPDPKLILRVNKYTPSVIWQKATKSILKGSGSPLLANDDIIIPLMNKFGYSPKDSWNFGVSACWEPLVIGKSLDQNNCIKNITILEALNNTLHNYGNKTYDELISNLDKEIYNVISHWDLTVKFDIAPLMSLLFDDCTIKGKDFSEGGARYNYHGLLVVGLPNLVNSVINIKEHVFENKDCTLANCIDCIDNDFSNHEDLRQLFLSGNEKFGKADNYVLDLTNHIMDVIDQSIQDLRMFGERIKVGFSSPSYIGLAKDYPASLDGRHKGDPFAVHISPISSDIDISEILDFASKLRYEGTRVNGNVVDFIVPASYAKAPNKLAEIIKNGIERGVYEMQLNVLDKDTLIDAKAHPEKYPNLVVRVWGFSAYFNDLPEEYKDNLIQRAELYE